MWLSAGRILSCNGSQHRCALCADSLSNVTDNHQEKNARALEAKAARGAVEKDCSGQGLLEEITGILRDPQRQAKMRAALQRVRAGQRGAHLPDHGGLAAKKQRVTLYGYQREKAGSAPDTH